MLYSLASLDGAELETIQRLETRLGKRVLALKPLDIEFDRLSDEETAEVQQLEVELGLVIVAVK